MLKLENSELDKQILKKKLFTANYLKIFYIFLLVVISLITNISIRSVHAEEITYYHNDVSGTPLLSTNSSGEVLWKENYRPYGDKLNNQTESQANQIGFHGKPYDNEIGLSYMQARYYNPTLGRFMGVDPLGYQVDNLHSFNRYAYANNNPYKYVDPDGNIPVDTIWDAASIVYDVGKIGVGKITGNLTLIRDGSVDLAADTIAIAVPYLPAGSTKVARAAGKSVSEASSSNHVYRGLAKGEDETKGLLARSPGAGNSEIGHVAGKKASQWISTTKDKSIAMNKYGENGVVQIDLNKVNTKISDVSNGFPKGGRMTNWAKRDQEVLIQNGIPPEAMKRIK